MKGAVLLAVILLASLAANYVQYTQMQEKDRAIAGLQSDVADLEERAAQTPAPQKPEPAPQEPVAPPAAGDSSQSIAAVAVRSVVVSEGFFQRTQYEGLVMNIMVDIRDGRGLVLVNTEIPAGVDFQTSAKTAVKVAQQHARADLSGKDVIFSIKSDNNESGLEAVDGPSAGAAMTLLLISELQSKDIDGTILVTGTIEPDGTVGRVGGVPEKALAAGEHGAKLLLVPAGEAVYESQVCQERQEGPFVYRSCTSEEKPLSPATEERYGMKVAEVENISQALEYF
ncbi:MAG: S16 family serine protease [Nitrososphaera sp.]|uniref:S16 family serine protease n=1 Tax=Nitrososphaera sp. TaxID=1971748 RepID=UPI003D6E7277